MASFPRDRALDATLALLREGYGYFARRFRELHSPAFRTRLALRRATCVHGAEAARMFFADGRFTRRGALPPASLTLLQDRRSVQWLDGAHHALRKAMFLELVARPEAVFALGDAMERAWRKRLSGWRSRGEVLLQDEAENLLGEAACEWAGLRLRPIEVQQRTRELVAMIEGARGPHHWRAQRLRRSNEKWARAMIEDFRAGRIKTAEDSALASIARHREPDGQELSSATAAVELINVLRPTVAVARYVTFAALALHEHPECREPIAAGDEAYLERFVHEVRRFYPFFPALGGRALEPFEWEGVRFPAHAWVLYDIYGTHHDAAAWGDPESFRPDRFLEIPADAPWYAPQGNGDYLSSHRCPGEPATLELTKRAAWLLVTSMRYEVPAQDLSIDLGRMPALPASRMRLRNVREGRFMQGAR
jgi:fatty-acid peroxygenase